jgi:hypothetical protein
MLDFSVVVTISIFETGHPALHERASYHIRRAVALTDQDGCTRSTCTVMVRGYYLREELASCHGNSKVGAEAGRALGAAGHLAAEAVAVPVGHLILKIFFEKVRIVSKASSQVGSVVSEVF